MASSILSSNLAESSAELVDLLLPPMPDGRVRFSRTAYHRMAEAGILRPDSRVELIDGEIIMMSPIGPPQGSLVTRLMNFFVRRLPDTLDCRVQLPIGIFDRSEPEPDIAIVRQRDDDYSQAHPTPDDTVLVVEVSQASLAFDLGTKLRLYAEAGIPEYWVLDIRRRSILVHRDPMGHEYRNVTTVGVEGSVTPLAVPDCVLDVGWLYR
jgi:Uma2 family endonuclease